MIAAMRMALLPLFALLLAAAAPSDEARRLMETGQELRAYQLIEAASNRGDVDAVDYLAWFFETGRVVARDLPRAAQLYRRAAECRPAPCPMAARSDARRGRRHPGKSGRSLRLDPSRRRSGQPGRLRQPRRHVCQRPRRRGRFRSVDALVSRGGGAGFAHGFYGVGVLYTLGQGVPRDEREGLAWMLCAATLGDESAARHIEDYHVEPGQSGAVIARANAIFRELGQGNRRVHVEDVDAPPVPVT